MSGRKQSALVDVAGAVLAETGLAFKFDDGARVVWLPKSQCEWDPDDETMAMPFWLAKEKELI
jgi:hypothetical protein